MKNLKYTLLHQDGKARYGKIEINGYTLETPVFMPVGTQATVKFLDHKDLEAMNASIILSNTYHLWLRPGEDILDEAGGIHEFMNYHNGPVLTDSGEIQITSGWIKTVYVARGFHPYTGKNRFRYCHVF